MLAEKYPKQNVYKEALLKVRDDCMETDKQALIDLIIWYRDEYHQKDWCHTKMIEEIKQIDDLNKLEPYWQVVDLWLD